MRTTDLETIDAPAAPSADSLRPPAGRTDVAGPDPTRFVGVFYAAGFGRNRSAYLLAAIAFFEREGHLKVPYRHKERGINLYGFMARIRAAHRARKLSDALVAAFDSIGMRWKGRPGGGRGVLSKAQRTDIVRLYTEDELSIRALAAAFDCSYGTIHYTLKKARATFRTRGGARTPRRAGDRR
jgi:hypothetical protein